LVLPAHEKRRDRFRPLRIDPTSERSADIHRETTAGDQCDSFFTLPSFDKPPHHPAERHATRRQRQRRSKAIGVNRHDGERHARIEEVQRHHQRVIQSQLVRCGEIELFIDAVFEKSFCQRNMAAHGVARHRAPSLLRALSFFRHADTERRQIVVEEIYKMIAVDLDDQIRFGLLHLFADLLHQRLALNFSRRLLHFENKPGRMRHAGGQDQFRHKCSSLHVAIKFSILLTS
jgi:hypothetical protein